MQSSIPARPAGAQVNVQVNIHVMLIHSIRWSQSRRASTDDRAGSSSTRLMGQRRKAGKQESRTGNYARELKTTFLTVVLASYSQQLDWMRYWMMILDTQRWNKTV